jgi:hypothetical protein
VSHSFERLGIGAVMCFAIGMSSPNETASGVNGGLGSGPTTQQQAAVPPSPALSQGGPRGLGGAGQPLVMMSPGTDPQPLTGAGPGGLMDPVQMTHTLIGS